eukprot:scaffold61530_cov21-Prasinocladus_malaysianus.AAC.1
MVRRGTPQSVSLWIGMAMARMCRLGPAVDIRLPGPQRRLNIGCEPGGTIAPTYACGGFGQFYCCGRSQTS